MNSPSDTPDFFGTKKVILFDFDGTLVDVMQTFIEICNMLAPIYDYPPIRQEEIPLLKNRSAREILRTRLKIPFWKLWGFSRRAHAEYRLRTEKVSLFPGMKHVIETLQAQGYRTGIVSSNSTETIGMLLQRDGLSFDFIESSGVFRKPLALKKTLIRKNLDPKDVIYIGDEVRDIEACRVYSIDMLAVTWGLNSKEALEEAGGDTVDTPSELLARFLSSKQLTSLTIDSSETS
jgi:HAD superfamily hydrolase (TIGR01549 family)